MMEYKGYLGQVEFDAEAQIFHGEVVNIRDAITFQGASVAELNRSFRDSVDDYLEFCRERGESPDKPFSGQFVARISPELHRQVNLAAVAAGKSLNAWVGQQLAAAVQSTAGGKPSGARKNARTARVVRGTKAAKPTRRRS